MESFATSSARFDVKQGLSTNHLPYMRDVHIHCQYAEFKSRLGAFIVDLAREHQFRPRRLTVTIAYCGLPGWDYYAKEHGLDTGRFFEDPLPDSLDQVCIRHETLKRFGPAVDRLMAHMATKNIVLGDTGRMESS
jgi:hypothetical protein